MDYKIDLLELTLEKIFKSLLLDKKILKTIRNS